jgi:hypothetical protein
MTASDSGFGWSITCGGLMLQEDDFETKYELIRGQSEIDTYGNFEAEYSQMLEVMEIP